VNQPALRLLHDMAEIVDRDAVRLQSGHAPIRAYQGSLPHSRCLQISRASPCR
jgi:hypothetical protein